MPTLDILGVIEIVVYGVILLLINYFFNKKFSKSNVWKIFLAVYLFKIIALLYNFSLLSSLADVSLITCFISVIVSNDEKVRKMLRRTRKLKRFSDNNMDEKKALYKALDSAVEILSKNKIGAIITFEKNDSLEEYIKTGVRVDAPVRSELLTTIFYPGTTLHDGAVIIRDNTIEAASVFYTPTTKALKGKFGARHRASLGVSEVCDAITVVVSEETGRISIVLDGELMAVNRENFLQTFKELMERDV